MELEVAGLIENARPGVGAGTIPLKTPCNWGPPALQLPPPDCVRHSSPAT